jgi:hypothetical protein
MMDETWKVISEALALQPNHPNWELVVRFLAVRPRDPRGGAECSRNTYDEMLDYMAYARETFVSEAA